MKYKALTGVNNHVTTKHEGDVSAMYDPTDTGVVYDPTIHRPLKQEDTDGEVAAAFHAAALYIQGSSTSVATGKAAAAAVARPNRTTIIATDKAVAAAAAAAVPKGQNTIAAAATTEVTIATEKAVAAVAATEKAVTTDAACPNRQTILDTEKAVAAAAAAAVPKCKTTSGYSLEKPERVPYEKEKDANVKANAAV